MLSDPEYPKYRGVWLEYGGTVNSGTVYCCGVPANRTRETPLIVEGIAIPLNQDVAFQRFDALIQRDEDVSFRATMIGRLFSGSRQQVGADEFWGGYGHVGLFSLLVIQHVLAVDFAEDKGRKLNPAAGT